MRSLLLGAAWPAGAGGGQAEGGGCEEMWPPPASEGLSDTFCVVGA